MKDPIKLDYRKPVRRRGKTDRQRALTAIGILILGVPAFFYLIAFIALALRHLLR